MLWLKLVSFMHVKTRIENVISFKQSRKPYLSLFNLFMALLLFAHVSALINYSVTYLEIEVFEKTNTWFNFFEIQSLEWWE